MTSKVEEKIHFFFAGNFKLDTERDIELREKHYYWLTINIL